MNLVDLILTVCLIATPDECREEHLYFESQSSLVECMVRAPGQIAQWVAEHPAYKVVRWRCAFPDDGATL